jgi:hypothetical protein
LRGGGERGLARGFSQLLQLLESRVGVLAQGGQRESGQRHQRDECGRASSVHGDRQNYCTIDVQASFAQLFGAHGWVTF